MEFFKELWAHKKEPKGRVDITMFFVNIFLILIHIFFMFVYVIVNHKFMININIISLIIYLLFFVNIVKHKDLYAYVCFFEIWVHMLCAILSFGWTPCFQNWTFAIIAAFFLPAFDEGRYFKSHRLSFLFVVTVILTYFGISVFIHVNHFHIMVKLNDFMTRMLFTVNNLISFFTIIMFAYFYTSSRESKVKELTIKAEYDELTSLYNRHAINNICEKIIEESKNNKKPYNVAMLDIDFFKNVNDSYGHTSGDLVLIGISDILRSISSDNLYIGRWGGEEFMLISSCDMKYSEFMNTLKKLRDKVNKHKFEIEDKNKINVTVSIGAASIYDISSLEDAISIADNNLYKAKETGRNKIVG